MPPRTVRRSPSTRARRADEANCHRVGVVVTEMRAALLKGPADIEVVMMAKPEPSPGEVLIRVEANAICGTDLKSYLGTYRRGRFPTVLGHELAGIVEAQPGVTGEPLVGQRVCVEPNICCGTCPLCTRGLPNLCPDYHVLGESLAYQGACAEFVSVPTSQIHVLPSQLSAVEGAMVQPFAISYEAVVRRGQVDSGERVLIIGAGPIGLTSMIIARQRGATVMMTDVNEARLAKARSLGADRTQVADPTDTLVETVLEWTDGLGVEMCLEAVGGRQSATLQAAQRATGARGRIVVVGGFSDLLSSFPVSDLKNREQSLIGSHGHPETFGPVLAMFVESGLRPGDLVSHTVGLPELGPLLNRMATNSEGIIKAVVVP